MSPLRTRELEALGVKPLTVSDNEDGVTESESDHSGAQESGEHEPDKDCETLCWKGRYDSLVSMGEELKACMSSHELVMETSVCETT